MRCVKCRPNLRVAMFREYTFSFCNFLLPEASKGTTGDTKCVTKIIGEVRGQNLRFLFQGKISTISNQINVLLFMSKMLSNSHTSIFNSEIFPGWYPRTPVKKGEGQKRDEGWGKERWGGCVMGVRGMNAPGSCSVVLNVNIVRIKSQSDKIWRELSPNSRVQCALRHGKPCSQYRSNMDMVWNFKK